MTAPILIDTGPLVAYLHERERFHGWAVEQFKRCPFPLLTCESVISEACFLMAKAPRGSYAVMRLLEEKIVAIDFELTSEIQAIARLLSKYENVPMSLADACLVRMSELQNGSPIMTLDSDFKIYRRHGRQVIPIIMPEPDDG